MKDYKINAEMTRAVGGQLILETAALHHQLDSHLIEALGFLGIKEKEMFMVTLTKLGKQAPVDQCEEAPGAGVKVIMTKVKGRERVKMITTDGVEHLLTRAHAYSLAVYLLIVSGGGR